MDPSTAIYESILNNDICGARETLRRYLREHGLLDAPALPIEHCLAVYKTLGECGLGRLAAGAVRAMACHPDAHIWQRLLYYWGLRGSLGFLVTLELLDQLESRITGEEGRRAPLRDLLLRPSSAAGQSHPFVSRRERRVLQDLASRPVRFLPAEKSLFGFAFVCLRACLYASGYWQRTARTARTGPLRARRCLAGVGSAAASRLAVAPPDCGRLRPATPLGLLRGTPTAIGRTAWQPH